MRFVESFFYNPLVCFAKLVKSKVFERHENETLLELNVWITKSYQDYIDLLIPVLLCVEDPISDDSPLCQLSLIHYLRLDHLRALSFLKFVDPFLQESESRKNAIKENISNCSIHEVNSRQLSDHISSFYFHFLFFAIFRFIRQIDKHIECDRHHIHSHIQ